MANSTSIIETTDAQNGLSEQQRTNNMLTIQLEALGGIRRNGISTADYKENRQFVPMRFIERRVDREGTDENRRAAQGEARASLTAWNSAYTTLRDDGAVSEDLQEVNEGLGQTHRAKLQADDSLKGYTENEFFHHGNHRGGREGRSSGGAGVATSRDSLRRQAATQRSAPVKRARVAKGTTLTPLPNGKSTMNAQPALHKKQLTTSAAARQPVAKGNVTKTEAAASRTALLQLPLKSRIHPGIEKHRRAIFYSGQLATPDDFMASMPGRSGSRSSLHTAEKAAANAESISETKLEGSIPVNETCASPGIPQVSAEEPSVLADLMDMDAEQNAPCQPVINFTHPRDGSTGTAMSLESMTDPSPSSIQSPNSQEHLSYIQTAGPDQDAGLLGNIEALQSLVADFQIGTDSDTESVVEAKPTSLSRPSSYSPSAMLALRPKAVGVSVSTLPVEQKAVGASASTLPVEEEAVTASVNTVTLPRRNNEKEAVTSSVNTVTLPQGDIEEEAVTPSVNTVTSLKGDDASESSTRTAIVSQQVIVGEHIHKSRFQRAQRLKVGEATPSSNTPNSTNPQPTNFQSSERHMFTQAKTNPSASHKPTRPGPSLPAHLTNTEAVTDQGAAVRAQYGRPPTARAPSRDSNSLLPRHLQGVNPVSDQSAAVRAQYGRPPTAPAPNQGSNILLPRHLRGVNAVIDQGAAVRAQYKKAGA